MALKAIMVVVAVFVALTVVVAAASQAAMEEEKEAVVEVGNGWKMVKHLRLLKYVRDSSVELKSNGGVSMKQNTIKTIAFPRQLLANECKDIQCGELDLPDDAKCPEECSDEHCDDEDMSGEPQFCAELKEINLK